MFKKPFSYFFIIFIILSVFPLTVTAENISGDEVLLKVKEARTADAASMTMIMELYNKAGDMRSRELKNRYLENGEEKSLIEFQSPADVAGTAFLSLKNKNSSEEDMYLYLPVLGSIRKISGSQKNGDFVGSDLTYNDITVFSGGNFKDYYSGEILEENEKEYILRLTPTDNDIDYSYGRIWVRKDIYYPVQIEFYDQSEELLKKVKLEAIEEIDGNWLSRKITVENVQKGSRTVMKMEDIDFNVELNEQIFTTRYLER
ncbi:MAG: outer membrane lipoprotein-sorting protein [Halanaerobium sp.]